MATPSNVIRVPKPAASSFNKHRLIKKNTLLLNQLKHFREVESQMPLEEWMDFAKIHTEGEAAQYIRSVTTFLKPIVGKAGGR